MVFFDELFPHTFAEFNIDDNLDDVFKQLTRKRLQRIINKQHLKQKKLQQEDNNENENNDDDENKNFDMQLDVKEFSPDEISIKVADNVVTIEAKHEEKEDENEYIVRHIKRTYTVPEDFNMEKIESKLSSNGLLSITVPKAEKELDYKIIPIERQTIEA